MATVMPGGLTITVSAYGQRFELAWRTDGALTADTGFELVAELVLEDVLELVERAVTVSDGLGFTGPATLEGPPELVVATIAAAVDEVLDVAGWQPDSFGPDVTP